MAAVTGDGIASGVSLRAASERCGCSRPRSGAPAVTLASRAAVLAWHEPRPRAKACTGSTRPNTTRRSRTCWAPSCSRRATVGAGKRSPASTTSRLSSASMRLNTIATSRPPKRSPATSRQRPSSSDASSSATWLTPRASTPASKRLGCACSGARSKRPSCRPIRASTRPRLPWAMTSQPLFS